MNLLQRTAVVATLVMTPAVAFAGTLTDVNGPVLVNTGKGFVEVAGPVALPAGASVMARKQGSAVVQFDDGCRVSVEPGAVVVVSKASPCKARGQYSQQRPISPIPLTPAPVGGFFGLPAVGIGVTLAAAGAGVAGGIAGSARASFSVGPQRPSSP